MKIIITEEQHRLIKESKGKLAKISLKSLPGDSNEERYLNFMKLYEKAKEQRKHWEEQEDFGFDPLP